MKRATQKRLEMIRDRVRSLKASFAVHLRSEDPDERLIPRVCAIVFREGSWLVNLVDKLHAKPGTKFTKDDDRDDAKDLQEAREFFDSKHETYADEVARNLFIDRVECEFITHMERLVLLSLRLDAQVRSQVASIDDDVEVGEVEDEIEAEAAK